MRHSRGVLARRGRCCDAIRHTRSARIALRTARPAGDPLMSPVIVTYGSLGLAIVLEVLGTTFLQQSEQFTRPVPTALMLVSYLLSLFLLSVALKTLPVGIAYAVWSGLGIVLISCVGYFVFKQTLDMAALIGLGLIIAGVIIVNVFSKSVAH
jgi:small multidrug resistance pump